MAARLDLVPVVAPGSYTVAGVELPFVATVVADKAQFPVTGKELVLVWNSGVADAHTVTITSVADQYGRTGDVTAKSLTAGQFWLWGPMKTQGWAQSNGTIYVEANHIEIKFAIIRVTDLTAS